jgi:hypothetical protein
MTLNRKTGNAVSVPFRPSPFGQRNPGGTVNLPENN